MLLEISTFHCLGFLFLESLMKFKFFPNFNNDNDLAITPKTCEIGFKYVAYLNRMFFYCLISSKYEHLKIS